LGEDRIAPNFIVEERKWAYLPVGPLARQFREGDQGVSWEEVRKEPSIENDFLGWDIMGKPRLGESRMEQDKLSDNQKIPAVL
jgi:hypothetical protein